MYVAEFIDIFLNLDDYLNLFINEYGALIYFIVFLIIFLETGVVIAPFFPGDSLLFTIGALSSLGSLNVFLVLFLLMLAAILGDSLNYYLGRKAGPAIFRKERGLLFNRNHLIRTQKFYEKYGGKTIVLARFLPIIRTFAPFIAGIGRMDYRKFLIYNVLGGICWVGLFVIGGYLFGNIPLVKDNFGLVVVGIIIISLIPITIEWVKIKKK